MPQSSPAKIVVIDDHQDHLEYLATLLRRSGYEVAAFTAAPLALAPAMLETASLVITDIFMPEMDGFEVLAALRKAHPALPLVAVSSADATLIGPMLDCIERLGARATFTKPIDAEALLRRVAALIAERRESPA